MAITVCARALPSSLTASSLLPALTRFRARACGQHLTFGKEFSNAIEAKQVAQQEAERQQWVVEKADKEREAAVIRAEGEAEAAQIVNAALAESGPGLIEVRRIDTAKEIAAALSQSRNVTYVRLILALCSNGCLNCWIVSGTCRAVTVAAIFFSALAPGPSKPQRPGPERGSYLALAEMRTRSARMRVGTWRHFRRVHWGLGHRPVGRSPLKDFSQGVAFRPVGLRSVVCFSLPPCCELCNMGLRHSRIAAL